MKFGKGEPTDAELAAALAASPLRRRLERPAAAPLARPPLALGKGHVALLLASGHLDGVVRPADGGPAHVVRGTARKVEYVASTDETENEDGSTTVKTTLKQKVQIIVRAVGADGDIVTFTGGA